MILYNKPYLTVEFDKNNNCLIQNWKGFSNSEQFREGALTILDLFKQHKATKMISNSKEQAVVKKEDSDFAANLFPELLQSGIKAMAFVVPDNVFTKMSVNNFTKITDNYLAMQYFDELNKAKEWIRNIN